MVSSGIDADGVVAVDGAGEDGALHRTGTKQKMREFSLCGSMHHALEMNPS